MNDMTLAGPLDPRKGAAPIHHLHAPLYLPARKDIEAAIETLVALLDALDPDPEAEDDDPSGQCDEDGVNTIYVLASGDGPGCRISDNDHDAGTGE